MRYENVDNDENIAHYFQNLSIDSDNNCMLGSQSFHPEFEQFQTSISQLHNSESKSVVYILADNIFKHRITLSDDTISSITSTPYILNLSTNSPYNNTKFQGLIINSSTSTWSTGGINQLKALQQLDISI